MRATGGGAASSRGSRDPAMGELAATVGRGTQEQPLMMAVLQGLTELSMDVADLKGAVYQSYEGPEDWSYVEMGMSYKKVYGKKCQEAKGTKQIVGHVKNYVMAAMFMAHAKDPDVSQQDKDRMEELVGKKLRGQDNKLHIENARQLEELVAHCQTVQGKKQSYINLKMKDTSEAKEVEQLLETALLKKGKRQQDPPPMRAVQRELKNTLMEARKARG